jgi:hypothetical protein
MDRRKSERVQVHFEARVTKLDDRQTACGRVSDLSKSGVSVTLPIQLAPGDSVQLEMADSVLAGTVAYSNPDGAEFRTGIEVVQVLLGQSDLSHILQRTLLEAMPATPGLETVETYCG